MQDLVVGLVIGFATGLGFSGVMVVWGFRSIMWALQPLMDIVAGIERDEDPQPERYDEGSLAGGMHLGPKRF